MNNSFSLVALFVAMLFGAGLLINLQKETELKVSPLVIEAALTCTDVHYKNVLQEDISDDFTGHLYLLPSGEICSSITS